MGLNFSSSHIPWPGDSKSAMKVTTVGLGTFGGNWVLLRGPEQSIDGGWVVY